jgi:hypothetical protein
METINMEDLHKYYEILLDEDDEDDEDNSLTVLWDYKNDVIDDLMEAEIRPKLVIKLNMMWINNVKLHAGWKKGEILYVYTKQNSDGYFKIFWNKDKEELGFYNVIIDKLGYASNSHFQYYTLEETDNIQYHFYIRTASIYNNNICNENAKDAIATQVIIASAPLIGM